MVANLGQQALHCLGIDASNLRRGGGVTHLVEVLRHGDPTAHGIERVVVWGAADTVDRLEARPWLERRRVPELDGGSVRRLYWQTRTLEHEAARACDILFVPGGMCLSRFRPFVTMSRNLLPFEPQERSRFGMSLTRLRYHLLERGQAKSFRNAAGVIFLTEFARNATFERLYGEPQNSSVIYHGVSESFDIPPRPPRVLGDCSLEKPFRWLYVSIVNHYKHQWHVADAVARLRQRGLPVSLDLIGPSYPPAYRILRATLDRLDPNGDFINYHGPVPYEHLREQYQQADGFVFASSCETYGQILVEAMRAGLPIACADRSAMPELLGDRGLYFDPEDPASIEESLRRMMEDTALRGEMARRSYQHAQTFTWARCADETFAFISRVGQQAVEQRGCR